MRPLTVLGLLLLVMAAGCSGESGSDRDASGGAVSETTSVSSAPSERYISQADLGDAWPLTVPGGMLRCEGPGAVSFMSDEGIVYAVNGTAVAWSRANNLAWSDIDLISALDPNVAGRKINRGPLINDGLALC